MINVISTIPTQAVEKEIICEKCNSAFKYNVLDIKEYHWVDYFGASNARGIIVCPVCKENEVIRVLS
ncbi:hypothetical protein GW796_08405 [archaeon]|nr:hypothetical protein [archaeon]